MEFPRAFVLYPLPKLRHLRGMELKVYLKQRPRNPLHKRLCRAAARSLRQLNTSWDALEPRQYLAIMGVLNSGVPIEDQLQQLSYILMRQPWNKAVDFLVRHYLTDTQLRHCAELCKFVFDDGQRLSKNHFPRLKHRRTTFHGPIDGMESLSFSQFMDADHALMYGEGEPLDKFAALASILYLPEGEGYDHTSAAKRLPHFRQLSDNMLYGIGFFFASVKSFWATCYPHLFVKSEGGKGGNWAEPLFAISEDPVRQKQNAEQRATTVLFFLDQSIKKQKEIERQMQQNHRHG